MVTRYFLRTRVLQGIYSYIISEKSKENKKERFLEKSIDLAEKEFSESLDDLDKLYILAMSFLVKLKKVSKDRIKNLRKQKFSNIGEALVSFSENKVIDILESNKELIFFLDRYKLSKFWEGEEILFDSILEEIEKINIEHRNTHSLSFDVKFLGKIYTEIISNNEKLNDLLEIKGIYWSTDIWAINGLLLKTINNIDFLLKENKLLNVFKDNYDKYFAKKIFLEVLKCRGELEVEISELSKNWDKERISEIDMILIKMGITERKLFKDEIPEKVILNEYIEISKEFSSNKSYTFVNGILNNYFKKSKI